MSLSWDELLPTAYDVYGKVMFSQASVFLFTGGESAFKRGGGMHGGGRSPPPLPRYGQPAVGTYPTGMHTCEK